MTATPAYKLPTSVSPQHYAIRLIPDLGAFTFAGEETVAITIHEPVSEIVLNAIELTIHSVSVSGLDGRTLAGTVSLDSANERATFHFPQLLAPGTWTLSLAFSGILNDKLKGFYRSTYTAADGQEKVLASTQFESTDARRAFPCWDEPAIKAVFQVTLVIDAALTAISNTAIVRETPLPPTGQKEVVFADTITMSSYLVAFIVGEFEATEPTDIDGTPLRVWAVPGKGHLAAFGQAIGAASLAFFSRYYGRKYPGDKLDLIAIPDFAFGAMENLGAITFRETALLVNENQAARSELERVADVVSHENAHMWFGDLVTMKWWNGLWLNEAFATFMEMIAVDDWKPEWQRWTSFAVSRAAALQIDGLQSTRSVEFPVRHPDEAAGMFDTLTYEKGAAVLRMLEQYLGPETFRSGISNYIHKHAYGNAETTDLWNAIEESAGQPVRSMMDSWVFQPGHPLISATVEDTTLVLSQHIFQYLPAEADAGRRWQVPVSIRARSGGQELTRTVLLEEGEVRLNFPARPDWVVVNADGHGFYRVRYSPDLLKRLTGTVHDNLSAVERFNLVNDTWAAALAGLTPLADYMDLLLLFEDETEHTVWSAILGSLRYLNRLLDPAQRPALHARVHSLVGPSIRRLGWQPADGEDALVGQLRGELLNALGTLGNDRATQAEARARYVAYKSDSASVDPNLVPALVSIVAHSGTEADYGEFYAACKTATTPQEEMRYLFALAAFQPSELFERALALTTNSEVRTQNAPFLMRELLLNTHRRERAWQFLKDNWDDMLRHYPDSTIPRMCEGITGLITPELEADVAAFFAAHPVKGGEKMIQQHLEKLRIAVACQQRESDNLRNYFEWTP